VQDFFLFEEPSSKCQTTGSSCCPCVAFKEFLKAMKVVSCSEVENRAGCSRGNCNFWLGCLKLQVKWDKDGTGCLMIDINVD
jgi:hypothetical protein